MPRIRMTLKQAIGMTAQKFNKSTLPELRAAVRALADVATKRLKTFARSGVTSPAERYMRESGGVKSTRGKGLAELRQEYQRLKGFLTSKTGSVSGTAKVQKDTIKSLEKVGISVDVTDYDAFWRAYEELRKKDPAISNKKLKYEVLEQLAERIEDGEKSVPELVQSMEDRLTEIYEQQQEEWIDADLSDFFTIGEDMEP